MTMTMTVDVTGGQVPAADPAIVAPMPMDVDHLVASGVDVRPVRRCE